MIYLVALALLILPTLAQAKTLYVNNSGSPACDNATTYANNDASNPWCLIGRAAWGSTSYASPNTGEAAQAGDIVLITAGTYSTSGNTSGGRFAVTLNPANSGTAGNPITFRGVGDVYIRMDNGVRGPVIGASQRNYITWDNVIVDDYYCGSVSDTGPVVFWDSTNGQLLNSEVLGHSGSYQWGYATFGGNYNAIRIESAHNITIKNNLVHRVHLDNTGVGGANETCVMSYNANDLLVEHNEFYDCGIGVFVKGQQDGSTQNDPVIRYNYVHDIDNAGIRVWQAHDAFVYQNIIASGASQVGLFATGYDAKHLRGRWINNTVYGHARGMMIDDFSFSNDGRFYNNLIVSTTSAIYGEVTLTPSTMSITMDRNFYYTFGSFAYYESAGTFSFATWQGYGFDTNSVTGTDPQFVNAAANNFHLQSGSAALTAGRVVESIGGTNGDTIPVGAYITGNETIGIEAATADNRRFSPAFLRRASYEVEP